MRNEIIKRLKEIEVIYNIDILYACESGSRAWGFPSIDSDYDVRFFYKHLPEWYLSIDDKKDTITDVGPVLDFAGWEVTKTLKLYKSSNSSLFEKLKSPIVYIDKSDFKEELNIIRREYYKPLSGMHHYVALTKGFMKEYVVSDKVLLKKYFYIIRSVLSAYWIAKFDEAPPMELEKLRGVLEDDKVNEWIDEMLLEKLSNDESYCVLSSSVVNDYLDNTLTFINEKVEGYTYRSKGTSERLNKLLRSWVLGI